MHLDYLTRDEFDLFVARFPFQRRISTVHLHQTKQPSAGQFRGRVSMAALRRTQVEAYGLQDFAQHVTLAPDGLIWLGRNWNLPPASATGHNGNQAMGPFMVTLVGDFDSGGDHLTPEQEASLLHVVGRIQLHAGLSPEALLFRSELTSGSGPGANVDKRRLLTELRKTHRALKQDAKDPGPNPDQPEPFSPEALEWNRILSRFLALPRAGGETLQEIPERHSPMHPPQATQQVGDRSSAADPWTAASRLGGPELTLEMIDRLQPYTVNLAQGRFSDDGRMRTQDVDVDAIFQEHIPRAVQDARAARRKLHLLFYAHGGLVSEKNALLHAYSQLDWWRDNHVYPIFFIWETGLLEILSQLLRGEQSRARDLSRQWITDPLLETLVRHIGGPTVWQGMKTSAARSSDAQGGARYVAQRLQDLCAEHGEHLVLHGVGHSAGSIFLSHFLPCALEMDIPAFETLQLLAPAITVADFSDRVAPLLQDGRIRHNTIFTLRRHFEERDPTARIYNRSILYMVHNALEPARQEPILGLEISLRRAEPDLQRLLGVRFSPDGPGQLVWTPTDEGVDGRSASQARTHVDFNVDPATMNSVLRRMLGGDDRDPIVSYPGTARDISLFGWDVQFDWPPQIEWMLGGSLPPVSPAPQPGPAPAPTALPPAPPPVTKPPAPPDAASPAVITQRRRALCVGIDGYSTKPLSGCVNDARRWDEVLQGLGFEPARLLVDGEATREQIMAELSRMVTGSRAGDVLVFQYAGHGIQLADVSGDEAGEDTPLMDEALCPYDFDRGAFLIDDDIAEIIARLPSGVNLTCFFDCCHSGTISRFAMGVSRGAARRSLDERTRFLPATRDLQEAHARFRSSQPASRMAMSRGPENMREVVFSACLSREVAWERGGHGEFTLRATQLLADRGSDWTNQGFIDAVVQAFGAAPRQHPNLDCGPASNTLPFLQVVVP